MPTTFMPPMGNPGGVSPLTVGPTGQAPAIASPVAGLKNQSDGLMQALMLAKLRQGKLGVPSIPGQVPGATTQPGVTPYTSTPGLPDQ